MLKKFAVMPCRSQFAEAPTIEADFISQKQIWRLLQKTLFRALGVNDKELKILNSREIFIVFQ